MGLGNPGPEYQLTRHNAGFLVLDRLARYYQVRFRSRSHGKYSSAVVTTKGYRLHLVKPLTYMNCSGEAVRIFLNKYHFPLDRVIIIVDDLALPFGRIRLKPGGSSGGHKGLASIIGVTGPDFPRLRVGIGVPHQSAIIDFVLERFTVAEQKILPEITSWAVQAIIAWFEVGIEITMSKFNGPVPIG